MDIHICGIDEAEWCTDWPTRVVSILQPALTHRRLQFDLPSTSVLNLEFDDTEREGVIDFDGYTQLRRPKPSHIARIIDFGRKLTEESRLLVHCEKGISRSPAAAFILLASFYPKQSGARLLRTVTEAAPNAWPMPYMVKMADDQLGRKGTLYAALKDFQGESG
jgi:predicted protein tyrosine phosphatase